MTQEIFKKNYDGTYQWRSSKVKEIFDDFDGKVDDKAVTGSLGDYRTQAITFKPNGSTDTIEIIGVNEDDKIEYKKRNKADIHYIELRGGLDSKDEQIIICNSILHERISKMGIKVKITKELKRVWKKNKWVYTE